MENVHLLALIPSGLLVLSARYVNRFFLDYGGAGVSLDDVYARVREELQEFQRQEGVQIHDIKAGHKVKFTALVPYHKGDMPEMCHVCGTVGVSGDQPCRSCTVHRAEAGKSKFDVFANQRDQAQMDAVRSAMREMKSKKAIDTCRKETGTQ